MPNADILCVCVCVFTAGRALIDIGEAMKQMAEVKDSLDMDVKQNFIDPLQAVADKDIKDIQVDSKRRYASPRTGRALTNELCSHSVRRKKSIYSPGAERWDCIQMFKLHSFLKSIINK